MQFKEQSAMEMLMTYSWAFLIIAIVIAIIIVLVGFKPPVDYLQSDCNIDPLFPCINTLLVYNATGPLSYTIVFKNDLGRSISIPANALKLSATGFGETTGTSNYYGNCTPGYVSNGGEIVCFVNITGSIKPKVGSTVTTPFTFNYSFNKTLTSKSLYYLTTGSSTQVVAPAGAKFYHVTFKTNTGTGYIVLNGVDYTSGSSQYLVGGTYKLYGLPPSGLVFNYWAGISNSNDFNHQSTNLTINKPEEIEAFFSTAAKELPSPNPNERYLIMYNPISGGKITPSAGAHLKPYKSTITISESNYTGYKFTGWTGKGVGNYTGPSSTASVSMDSNITETANYDVYLTELSSPSGGASSLSPGSGWYAPGSSLTISESNNTGYKFVDWTGYQSSNSASFTMTVPNSPFTETANYNVALKLSLSPNNAGIATVSPGGSTPSYAVYWETPGSSLKISESNNTGYKFVDWTGYQSSNSASFTMTVPNSPFTETANYDVYLTMENNPSNGGSVSPSSGWYSYGSQVTISESPNSGYSFSRWSGSGSGSYTGSDSSYTITMNNPITEEANYGIKLTMSISDSNAGTISPNPGSHIEPYGSQVTISESPNSGYSFTGWSGSGSGSYTGSDSSYTITMNNPITEEANYDVCLTMSSSNSNAGSISPGSGTHCYSPGQSVTLSESANLRYEFTGWSGSGSGSYSGSDSSPTINMNSPITETANYKSIPNCNGYSYNNPNYNAQVTAGECYWTGGDLTDWVSGGNAGYADITLVGLSNGASYFGQGTTGRCYTFIGIDNLPEQNYEVEFGEGGGGGSCGNAAVKFNTDAPLTVNTNGDGSTSPSGTNDYQDGSSPQISASSNTGYHFTSWSCNNINGSGCYSGSNNPAYPTMNGHIYETANFAPNSEYDYIYSESGPGSVSPSGSIERNYGSSVTITANPDSGYCAGFDDYQTPYFEDWTGTYYSTSQTFTFTQPNSGVTEGANFGIKKSFCW